MDMSKLELNN